VENNPLKFIDPTGLRQVEGTVSQLSEEPDEQTQKSKRQERKERRLLRQQDRLEELRSRDNGDMGVWEKTVNDARIRAVEENIRSGIEDYLQAGFDSTFVQDNSSIQIRRGTLEDPDLDGFDGEMWVESFGVNISGNIRVRTVPHTSAQAQGWEAIPEDDYIGYLLDFSGSYEDPILLMNDNLDASDGGVLIHPNYRLVGNSASQNSSAIKPGLPVPTNLQYSEGCQITCGEGFNRLNQTLTFLGFSRVQGSTYSTSRGPIGNPQTILIQLR
jgi:hypothetical protein